MLQYYCKHLVQKIERASNAVPGQWWPSITAGYLPLDSPLLRPQLLQEDRLSRQRQRLMGGESFLDGQGGREEGWWAPKDATLWGGVVGCVLGGIQTEKTQDVWEYLVEIFQVVFFRGC